MNHGHVSRKRWAVAGATAAAIVVASASAAANPPDKTAAVTAKLNASQLVPKPSKGSNGSGSLTGTVLRIGKAGGYLTWTLKFGGLTGSPTAAEIHVASSGKLGPFAILLCKTCHSGQQSKSSLSPITANALMSDGAYVVILTHKHPHGEIRGQIGHGKISTIK
jgi:hypothetical protein